MSLSVQYLPAVEAAGSAPELVLLHGWGMSSRVWRQWLPVLRLQCNITLIDLPGYGSSDMVRGLSSDELLAQCAGHLPPRSILLGYSLGGMLATRIAHRYPGSVAGLITLASNYRFVASDSWPEAMAVEVFSAFAHTVEQQPVLALKKFAGLQLHGLADEKALLRSLRSELEEFSEGVLSESLRWLSELDNLQLSKQLQLPVLQLFGSEDNLVPVAAAEQIRDQQTAQVGIIAGAPHALFLSHPQQCWQQIQGFLQQHGLSGSGFKNRRALDKQQVARSFSRAAATYDSVAELQRRVGEALIATLPHISAGRVLDLGCGTGYFSPQLQQCFADSEVVGLDLAEGMLRYASGHRDDCNWICADAENLPLAKHSVELIFSSLAIQWCEDIDALFAEAFRVLKPGGYFAFATLGPETLHELRDAWQEVDNLVHVNRFEPWPVLRQSMTAAGFNGVQSGGSLAEENITLEYQTLKQLAAELKGLGVQNVNSGRRAGLTGKRRLRAFMAAYDRQRNDRGLLPATYQAWYGLLQKAP